MAGKPYDVALKDLYHGYLQDMVPLSGRTTKARLEVIDADVSTVSAAVDKVLWVQEAVPWLLHVEMQASHEVHLPERLHWYNALLRHRHKHPVQSVVVLLRREADAPNLTGAYHDRLPGERPYLEFHYQVVRLWQLSPEKLFQSGLGLLPLAPLSNVQEKQLPSIIRRMKERVEQETSPPEDGNIWTITNVLMGLRYPTDMIEHLLRGVRNMKESVTYQAIVAEGVEKGLEAMKESLLHLGTKRFGPPTRKQRKALHGITELARLMHLTEAILDAGDWNELLALK